MIISCSPIIPVIPRSEGRSPGVHLSGVIRAIAGEVGILKLDPEEDPSLIEHGDINDVAATDPYALIRIAIGLAWEQWYIKTQLPEVTDHPGEWESDGIFMTPDGEELSIVYRQYRVLIHEIKATYKSTKTIGIQHVNGEWVCNPDIFISQWMWLAQIRGYCRKAKTRFAVLHILCLCNDYSWPMRPMCYRLDIEFTDDELDRSWQTITDYKDERMAA